MGRAVLGRVDIGPSSLEFYLFTLCVGVLSMATTNILTLCFGSTGAFGTNFIDFLLISFKDIHPYLMSFYLALF